MIKCAISPKMPNLNPRPRSFGSLSRPNGEFCPLVGGRRQYDFARTNPRPSKLS